MDTQTAQDTATQATEPRVFLLKTLGTDYDSPYQGFSYTQYLPTQDANGDWTPGPWLPPVEDDLAMCENGWHVTTLEYLHEWYHRYTYVAEPAGWVEGSDRDILYGDSKIACRSIRLVRPVELTAETMMMLAADAAEHAIHETYQGHTFQMYANRTVMGLGKQAWLKSVPGLLSQLEDVVRGTREAVLAHDTSYDTIRQLAYKADNIYEALPSALDGVASVMARALGAVAQDEDLLYQAMQLAGWDGPYDESERGFYLTLVENYLRHTTAQRPSLPEPLKLLTRTQPGFTETPQYLAEELERAKWHGPVLKANLRLFKTLLPDGTSPYQYERYTQYLPTQDADGNWVPGPWTTPVEDELRMCRAGYHLTDANNIMQWMNGMVYVAELATDDTGAARIGVDIIGVEEDGRVTDTKVACRSIRLVRPLTVTNSRVIQWGLDALEYMHNRLTAFHTAEGYGMNTAEVAAFNELPGLLGEARSLVSGETWASPTAAQDLLGRAQHAYYSVSGVYDKSLSALEQVTRVICLVADHATSAENNDYAQYIAHNINELCGDLPASMDTDVRTWAGNRLIEWLEAEVAPAPAQYPIV
jgi:hypothetical protein